VQDCSVTSALCQQLEMWFTICHSKNAFSLMSVTVYQHYM